MRRVSEIGGLSGKGKLGLDLSRLNARARAMQHAKSDRHGRADCHLEQIKVRYLSEDFSLAKILRMEYLNSIRSWAAQAIK